MNTNIRARQWTQVSFEQGLEVLVPKRAGVYIIVAVHRYHGLPASLRYIYIGKSTNLRRRYREHANLSEPNPGLNRLEGNNENYEFWWVILAHEQLANIEQSLIRSLMPEANRITYGAQFTPKMEENSYRPRSHCC